MRKLKILLVVSSLFLFSSFRKNDINTKHIATWYDMSGRISASGVRMSRDSATAAYNAAPFGTKLLVTNLKNNKTCIVTVTDRMELKTPNHIDLSYKAFGLIEKHRTGKISVKIKRLD